MITKTHDEQISQEFDITKSPIVLEIYETFPLLLCHDGFFFINVGFEQQSWQDLQTYLSKEQMKLCDMIRYRLSFDKIKLHIRKVDSRQVFTSYGTLEVRLVVSGNVKVLGG